MSKKQIEYKTFPFEIKEAEEDQGVIEGYASTFGNVDLGLDIVDRGAFKKTLRESGGKIPILADHMPTKQVGWNLKASEDNKGLLVKGELDIKNNQLARERFSLSKKALEIGADAGFSIGYMTIKAEPDHEKPRIRRLKELKLFEYSLVTFPMNTQAMATSAKSWIQGGESGLGEHVDWFFKHMESIGFGHKDVKEALQHFEAAKNSNDPDPLVQSIDRVLAVLNS